MVERELKIMLKDSNISKTSASTALKNKKTAQITLPEQHLTAVFIDYENIYCALLREFTNIIHMNFFPKFSLWCEKTGRKLCKKMAYCNFDYADLSLSHHQTLLNSLGMQSIHTSNNGKNCADLQIAVDVMECIHNYPEIEEYIIVSNDKDMIPVLNSITMHGKIATFITVGDRYDGIVENYANNHISIEKIMEESVPNQLLECTSERMLSYIEESLQKHIHNRDYKTKSFYALDRFLSVFSKHFRIMTYEIATILKELYKNGKICFAEYHHYRTSFIAIIPSRLKDEVIRAKWTNEADIKQDFDIDFIITNEYSKAQKHLSN